MIVEIFALLALAGQADAPAKDKAAKDVDPRKAAWVCERQRMTGTNMKKTVCMDKRTRRQEREEGERIIENERERVTSEVDAYRPRP